MKQIFFTYQEKFKFGNLQNFTDFSLDFKEFWSKYFVVSNFKDNVSRKLCSCVVQFCLQSSYYSVIVFIFELFFFKLKSNGLIYLYFHLQFETNNNNYCSWKTSVRLSCRWPKTRILVLRLRAFLGCYFFARQSWNASMIPTCIARCK